MGIHHLVTLGFGQDASVTSGADEERIAAIKSLIQQALNASKPNTAKAILTPLKTAMSQ